MVNKDGVYQNGNTEIKYQKKICCLNCKKYLTLSWNFIIKNLQDTGCLNKNASAVQLISKTFLYTLYNILCMYSVYDITYQEFSSNSSFMRF